MDEGQALAVPGVERHADDAMLQAAEDARAEAALGARSMPSARLWCHNNRKGARLVKVGDGWSETWNQSEMPDVAP